MKFKFIATILLFLISCRGNQCEKSKEYLTIENYINIIDENHEKSMYLYGDQLFANLVLTEITGIESKANYGDISEYSTRNDLISDIKAWRKWLRENQCVLNKKGIERKIKLIKE